MKKISEQTRESLRALWNHDPSAAASLFEQYLCFRAGNTGELVQNNPPRFKWQPKCPFCGCRSWFSFIEDKQEKQDDDVFECLRCMATSTRLDHCGGPEAWKTLQMETRP
jgi:hypothetical protein